MIQYSLTVVTEDGLGFIPLKAFDHSVTGEAYSVVRKATLSGMKELSFSIPIEVDDGNGNSIVNPRWSYVRGDSIIRLKFFYDHAPADITTEDYVVSNIDASHEESAIANVLCQSKALYRLGKVGYKKYFGDSNGVSLTLQQALDTTLKNTEWSFDVAGSDVTTQTLTGVDAPKEEYTALFDGLKMGIRTDGSIFTSKINNGAVVNNFTLEFYIRPRASLTDQILIDMRDSTKRGAVAFITPEGHIAYFHSCNEAELEVSDLKLAYRTEGDPIIQYYKWNHIVITHTANGATPTIAIYHNHVPQAVTAPTTPAALKPLNSSLTYVYMFRSVNISSPYQIMPMGCHLGAIRCYDTALSHANVDTNYDNATKALLYKVEIPDDGTPHPYVDNANLFLQYNVYAQNALSLAEPLDRKHQYLYNFKNGHANPPATDGLIEDYWEDPAVVGISPAPALYFWIDNIKRKTVVAANSNLFDIIQTICELFDVYPRFVTTDPENLKLQVYSVENLNLSEGRIAYGYNLKSASTTIDSKAMVTKLFVRGPTGPNGAIVSITDSESNLSSGFCSDYILDFSYYNDGIYALTDDHVAELAVYKDGGDSVNPTHVFHYEGQRQLFADLKILLHDYTDLLKTKLDYEAILTDTEGKLAAEETDRDESLTLRNTYTLATNPILYEAANTSYKNAINNVSNYTTLKTNTENSITALNTSIKSKRAEIDAKYLAIELEDAQFALMFGPYIKEGVWQSEDIFDAEELYLTALNKIMPKYSLPKITSEVSFIDLYTYYQQGTKIDLATIVRVIDDYLDINEDFIITEISLDLDNQLNSSVSISNYADNLENLFNKLIVGVEALNINKDVYGRAGFFSGNGAIDPTSIARGATSNQMEFNIIADGSIKITREGIIIADYVNDASIKISVGGIYTKSSSDDSYRLLFSTTTLNLPEATIGRISTNELNIYGGSDGLTADSAQPSFIWNGGGIYAYGPQATYDANKYLRLYEKGMEMYNGDPTNYQNLKLFIGNISNAPNANSKVAALYPSATVPYGYGLVADNVYLTGGIVANYGSIGGWKINQTNLESAPGSSTVGLYLDTAGNIRTKNFISGNFGRGWEIDQNGRATFQDIIARGSIQTAIFEVGKSSAVGGSVFVRQGWTLNTSNIQVTNNGTYTLVLDKPSDTLVPAESTYLMTKTNAGYYYFYITQLTNVLGTNTFTVDVSCITQAATTNIYKGSAMVHYGSLYNDYVINNIINNGSFETAPLSSNYTTISGSITQESTSRYGSYSAKLSFPTASFKQAIPVLSGHKYMITYVSRVEELNDIVTTQINQAGAITAINTVSEGIWLRTISTFDATGTRNIDVIIGVSGVDKYTYIDGLMAIDLTAAEADSGVLFTAMTLGQLASFVESKGGYFDSTSQGLGDAEGGIVLTSSENDSPYLDIYQNVSNENELLTNPFQNTKLRLGKLTGVNDVDYGALTGYGLYADNVYLRGAIVAVNGSIGGWLIEANSLTANSGVVGMSSAGLYRFWAGNAVSASAPFRVTDAGALTASLGYIGGWQILENSLMGTSTTLWSNGQINTANFSVNVGGAISATSGILGGWNIGPTNIKGGSTILNSSGTAIFGTTTLYTNGQINAGTLFSVSDTGIIQAASGAIAGWTIVSNRLGAGSTNLWSTGQLNVGTAFGVSTSGVLSATGAIISGTITATSGVIGGFTIGADALYDGTAFVLNTTGHSILLWNGASGYVGMDADNGFWTGASTFSGASSKFRVSNAGFVNAVSGNIGGWNLASGTLYRVNSTFNSSSSGAMYFGSSGLSVKNLFNVSSTGRMYTADMYAIGGYIGGWTIDDSSLTATVSGSTATISPTTFYVYCSGDAALISKGGLTVISSQTSNVSVTAQADNKKVYIQADRIELAPSGLTATNGIFFSSGMMLQSLTYQLQYNSTSGKITYYSSSEEWKNKIGKIDLLDDAKKLLEVPTWLFNYKDENVNYATSIGYMAEEISLFGIYDLVYYDEEAKPRNVHYQLLGMYALSLIKDLYNEINSLKSEIQLLKSGGTS